MIHLIDYSLRSPLKRSLAISCHSSKQPWVKRKVFAWVVKRKHEAKLNGQLSWWKKVMTGVLQGFVCGAHAFLHIHSDLKWRK